MATYSSASYAMGATELSVPITTLSAQKNKRSLGKMRSSLRAWMKYRALNDKTTSQPPPNIAAARARTEQNLADQLYQLLSEVFDSQALPDPDVSKNPQAAVELAQLAVAGKLPGDSSSPQAQGFVWLWPVVFIVGAIAYVIATEIKSSADLAKEQERYQCIQSGACTDYGFWLKAGGIAALAYVGWQLWKEHKMKP